MKMLIEIVQFIAIFFCFPISNYFISLAKWFVTWYICVKWSVSEHCAVRCSGQRILITHDELAKLENKNGVKHKKIIFK